MVALSPLVNRPGASCCIIAWLVCEKLIRYSSGIGLFIGPSMQLHMRFGAPRDQSRKGIERYLGRPVQREFMHLVERSVHQPREQALGPWVPPYEPSHEVTDRRVFAERNERAEVAIAPRRQRFAAQPSLDLLDEMHGLLVRCLRAGWDITARMTCPRASGTVADDEYVFVARRLQRRQHDELVDTGALETVKIREDIRCLDPGRPDHELGRNESPVRKLHSSRADLRDLR